MLREVLCVIVILLVVWFLFIENYTTSPVSGKTCAHWYPEWPHQTYITEKNLFHKKHHHPCDYWAHLGGPEPVHGSEVAY